MRFYGIKNMYMNGIHTGIQCGHVVTELFNKYGGGLHPHDDFDKKKPHDMLWDWNRNHKTWVLLDGGYADNLRYIIEVFKKYEDEFPWASFHEEQAALDGALTAIGIILPGWIYDARRDTSDSRFDRFVHKTIVREYDPTDTEQILPIDSRVHERIFNPWDKYYDLIKAVSQLRLAS